MSSRFEDERGYNNSDFTYKLRAEESKKKEISEMVNNIRKCWPYDISKSPDILIRPSSPQIRSKPNPSPRASTSLSVLRKS